MKKQARMGYNDIAGKHSGGSHINLETYGKDGKISTNEHVFIK